MFKRMSDEKELSSFLDFDINKSDATVEIQNFNINDEQTESIKTKENDAMEKEISEIRILNPVQCENLNEENENTEIKIVDASEDGKKPFNDEHSINENEIVDRLLKTGELDEKYIHEHLKNIEVDKLQDILKEVEQINFYLLKENEVYEFVLNADETVQDSLGRKVDEDIAEESFTLSSPAKCYFAKKKLEHDEEELESKKAAYSYELQNLNFQLLSLNMSLKDLQVSQEKFVKNIKTDGRHPVTKKIILQKVSKYFDDSIRTKMALSNRYKIQIQSDIMERNKMLSQIKAQEKRIASLDMTEFQKVQFEHKRSCKQLAMYKSQLGKFKVKFSPLLQSLAEMKRSLEKEENEMEQMKNAVSKLEHLKEVMLTEKTRNDQKALELKAQMRKIKLDPRRHNLPEVIDYAAAKRENASLVKNISKWQKKIEVLQQEKLLYLSALSKKKDL